jgi:hypothetical protein
MGMARLGIWENLEIPYSIPTEMSKLLSAGFTEFTEGGIVNGKGL